MDNFNGPVGLLVGKVEIITHKVHLFSITKLGCAIGITRTMYCDPKNIADFTPVDVCVKAMIIAAWKRAHEPKFENFYFFALKSFLTI